MKNKKYNLKARESVVEEMERLLKRLQKHYKYLILSNKKLNEIDKDLEIMKQYYFKDWLDDYNNFSSNKFYDVLSQDHIYNSLENIHKEKIKLLKIIVKTLR